MSYKFREFYIPERMMPAIERYVKERVTPGHFLQAVISNDLRLACANADEENLRNLPAYIAYLYNETPLRCWGSREKMLYWISGGNNE